VTSANCHDKAVVTGGKHHSVLPQSLWINTLLDNLKASFCGTLHAFIFDKYVKRYLSCFCFRFIRRFSMVEMRDRIAHSACCCIPCAESDLSVA